MIRAFSFFTLFLMVQTLSAQELVDGFCRDGQGYFEFTDGEYFGECKNRTTMHGEGEYIFYSGATFSGTWINSKKNGLLISEEQLAKNRKNGDTSEMMVNYNGNDELCENCGNIPDNMIKKDLVKSMCIGCNNIDNVLE